LSDIEAQILEGFGDTVDRIVATPTGAVPLLRKGRGGPVKNRYNWMKVYDETRQRYGRSLTLLAAEKLRERVTPGSHVLIVTNSHEMDGPPGSTALARLLGNPDVMHDEQTHYRTLVNCADEGIPDGATAMPSPSTDGCSHEACMAVITQLRQTLLMSMKEIVRESR